MEYLKKVFFGEVCVSYFVNCMLFLVMIEVWSCECFRLLLEEIVDFDLCEFYCLFMESEVCYYIIFLGFVWKYGDGIDVDVCW